MTTITTNLPAIRFPVFARLKSLRLPKIGGAHAGRLAKFQSGDIARMQQVGYAPTRTATILTGL